MKPSLTEKLLSLVISLSLMMSGVNVIPLWDGAVPTATADDFKSIGDQLGSQQVNDMALFCNYTDKVLAVMNVLKTAAAANPDPRGANSTTFYLISKAEEIPQMCNVVMAILSAKNLDGVLRAARMANRAYVKRDDTALDFIEDSVDLAVTLDEFGKSKDTPLDKALNAGMYARVLNYAFKYSPLERQGTRMREVTTAASRQTQLINDMKLNNQCLALSTSEKQDQAKVQAAKKDYIRMPNGLEIKTTEVRRLMRRQQAALDIINGNAASQLKTLATSLMSMIQLVDTRGSDSLEVSGEIIRRILDTDKPYPAVGYDASKVTQVIEKKDGETTFVENDICNKQTNDTNDPEARKISDADRKRKCQLFKERVDLSKAYYRTSSNGLTSACSDASAKTNKLEIWEARNIAVLADPNFDPRVLSSASDICADGNFDNVQINMLVAGMERRGKNTKQPLIYSDKDAENAEKKRQKDAQDDCIDGASKKALKRFNSLNSFGSSADNPAIADWKTQSGCAPMTKADLVRSKQDGDPVRYESFAENFKTVKEWRNYYNGTVNNYIAAKYKGIEDTETARDLRGTRRIDNALEPESSGFGNENEWNTGDSTWNNPLAKIRRLQGELGLVSLCELPSYLKRHYPDKQDMIDGAGGEDADAKGLLILTQQCRNEQEGQVGDYLDIFNSYMEAIHDVKLSLADARRQLFDIDVLLGSYIGTTGVRKAADCNSVRSTQQSAILTNNLLGMQTGILLDIQQSLLQKTMTKKSEKMLSKRAIKDFNRSLNCAPQKDLAAARRSILTRINPRRLSSPQEIPRRPPESA